MRPSARRNSREGHPDQRPERLALGTDHTARDEDRRIRLEGGSFCGDVVETEDCRRLLALPVLLAACIDGPSYHPQAEPITPITSRPLQTIADRPTVIAVGGAQTIAIDDPTSIGWSGAATTGFRVEPFDSDGWPNTERAEYWVRAVGAGTGSYAISTNRGMAVGTVDAAPVARVALIPVDYQLDGHSAFALAPIG